MTLTREPFELALDVAPEQEFSGSLHECLNEHWFTNVLHARTVIENWRREYNEERPKKALGGLTPAAYAEQLMKISYSEPGL